MRALRAFATIATTALLVFTIALYGVRAARGSDHQDSPTVVARPGADITDLFVYPAPDNANNVVLAMDVYPLIPGGMSSSAQYAFDPAVLYQFKIASNIANKDYAEKNVIQFTVNGTGQGQTLTMYGPSAPNEVGTTNTLVKTTGNVPFNQVTSLDNGQIQVFAGPRRDPFFFDLAQFFKIVPDRNYQYHQSGATPPPATASSFNGFPAGNAQGCLTTPASNILANFNVLQIAVELPKTMLEPSGSALGQVGVWATTATTTGS
ncbi:MAG: DUF4331 family protein [bacterium]|nr:DUF4331 family protein [bacterium]